ncbi:MAG: hypothetical protein HY225_03535 [Candidatus Vogelbacteria bacterium]|nr:hypothetical protein [Candidatus Vogelbacteria bacterium]
MNFSHHAYLYEGDLDTNLRFLRENIEKLVGVPAVSYTDYFECVRSNFTVADSELFISKQSTMSFGGGKRFFILVGQSFTPEAQNKLLKVLEEPLVGNHVFVVVPSSSIFLPTLLSRLSIISGSKSDFDDAVLFCQKFISVSLPDRLIMIENFLKANDGDDETIHVKHLVKDIFGQLEKIFASKLSNLDESQGVGVGNFLVELLGVKKYLDDSSPAVKMIFEYVAFICPGST